MADEKTKQGGATATAEAPGPNTVRLTFLPEGKTVEFEIFPRGGHVLSEPAQQREIMRRNLAWFVRWLKP